MDRPWVLLAELSVDDAPGSADGLADASGDALKGKATLAAIAPWATAHLQEGCHPAGRVVTRAHTGDRGWNPPEPAIRSRAPHAARCHGCLDEQKVRRALLPASRHRIRWSQALPARECCCRGRLPWPNLARNAPPSYRGNETCSDNASTRSPLPRNAGLCTTTGCITKRPSTVICHMDCFLTSYFWGPPATAG
jgi:hypothetical protein